MDLKDKKIAELEALVLTQQKQVEVLTEKLSLALAELSKRSIKKDSGNSSLPPSQDKGFKSRTKSLRRKSQNSSGGQKGHKGSNLKMVAVADEVIGLKPSYCQGCGKGFSASELSFQKSRQVVDIPLPRPFTKEYQQFKGQCSCGHEQFAAFPSGVNSPVQYGKNVEAMVGYLSAYQYLPFKRMTELFRDLFSIKLSQGTIDNMLNRLKKKGLPYYSKLRAAVENSKVVGADETSCSVNGANHWAWVWQTPDLCYMTISENRGKATVGKAFPNGFAQAVLSSDRWATHLNTKAKAHQICLAHLLRELNYLEAAEKHPFSISLQALFRQAIHLKKQQGCPGEEVTVLLEKQLDLLLQETIPKDQFPDTARMQKSMIKLRDAIFTFLYNTEISPDNNASERAIRNVKVKMKVSGQFKTGQENFAVLRSIIESLKKKKQNTFKALTLLANVSPQYKLC